MNTNLPDILTIKEIAIHLRIGLNSAYRLVRRGEIKSIRVGRQHRIPRQAILDYMASSTSC